MLETLQKLLIVAFGGSIGSVMRYLLSGFAQDLSGSFAFPFGTMAVNLTGCFVIGVLSYFADARGVLNTEIRILLFAGLMGGFTTFSTFGNETINLIRDRQLVFAAANVCISVIGGLLLVWAGRTAAHLIWR